MNSSLCKTLLLACIIFSLTGDLYARGIFGGLGRSLRQVGREVTSAVKDTTSGIKGDVQSETGIPIAQIEMRDRIGRIRKYIGKIRVAVVNPSVADGAILFFWNSISVMDMSDSESLRKVVEYTEGTITDVRKEGISEGKLRRGVERLESLLMSLSSKQGELPEGFDFATAFSLNPSDPQEGAQPEFQSGEASTEGGTSEDGEDPVAVRYRELLEEHKGTLNGTGYLKVSTNSEGGSDASFTLLHPGTSAVLAENVQVNKNHRLESGIYHVVIDVADVRLYKLNVVIGPGSLTKFDYVDFGQIEIASDSVSGIDVYDASTERLACEALVAGDIITVPSGEYILVHNDSGAEQNVLVNRKKRKNVAFAQ